MRDELYRPLSGPPVRPRAKGGVASLVALAALVGAGMAGGELALVQRGGAVVPAAPARAAPPRAASVAAIAPPPLRLAETVASDPAPAPPAPPDTVASLDPAKPARPRPGATEPLIIDVRRALTALQAQDPSAGPR